MMTPEERNLLAAEPFLEAAVDGMTGADVEGVGAAMVLWGLGEMEEEACCKTCLADSLEELSRQLAEKIRHLRGGDLVEH